MDGQLPLDYVLLVLFTAHSDCVAKWREAVLEDNDDVANYWKECIALFERLTTVAECWS